jgi:hypothetical protein
MLMAAFTLYNDMYMISYIAQGFIVVAFSMLLFGKFCLGAYIFHLLKGKINFANETMPWQNNFLRSNN